MLTFGTFVSSKKRKPNSRQYVDQLKKNNKKLLKNKIKKTSHQFD